ncbi:MAG: NTP transferase domain-containing protein [Sphaerochaetaceae bacterium]
MKISEVGGLIAAASKKATQPLMKIGAISIIKRIVIAFQQAGIFPIVVVTGAQEPEVMYQLSAFGVIFLHNDNNEEPQLFDSVKLGLTYLEDKCDRVVFTPVNVPMFSPVTLNRLIATKGDIITPVFQGRGGHPVVISNVMIQPILSYQGKEGLRGAFNCFTERRIFVEVKDEGILQNVHSEQQLHQRLETYNRELLHPVANLLIEKENPFFNARGKLLLFLISDTASVRKACDMMALSYGKAWEMINALEKELGYPVVNRHQGGFKGGNTELTSQGVAFLDAYQRLEDKVFRYTQKEFELFLQDTSLL